MKSNNSELAGAFSIEKSVGSSVYVSLFFPSKKFDNFPLYEMNNTHTFVLLFRVPKKQMEKTMPSFIMKFRISRQVSILFDFDWSNLTQISWV